MKNRRSLCIVMIGAFLTLTLAGCATTPAQQPSPTAPGSAASATPPKPAETIKLSLAASGPDKGMNKEVTLGFENRVKELSNGRIIIERFMGGTLGGEMNTYETLGMGEIAFVYGGVGPSRYAPDYDPTMINFLFPDFKSIARYWSTENPIYETIQAELVSKGKMRHLATANGGERWMTSNTEIKTVSDLKGIKLRIPEVPEFIEIWKSLGTLPAPIPAPETYNALQMGVIDAQENLVDNILGRKIYEVQKYLVATGHSIFPMHLVMSDTVYQKLSAEDRKLIEQAAVEAVNMANVQADELLKANLKALEELGMEINRPNIKEIQQMAQPAMDALLSKQAKGVVDAVKWATGSN